MPHTNQRGLTFLILLVAVLACGAATEVRADDGDADTNALNEMCPVMPEVPASRHLTLIYEGKKVAFCCDRCMVKFKANPEAYLHRLPQFASIAGPAPAKGVGEASPASEQPSGITSDERPSWFGRIHPVIVHMPVAGLPLALLGFVVWSATGRPSWSNADKLPLLAATVGAVAAFFTGGIAEETVQVGEMLASVVERHETGGTVAMIGCLLLCFLRIWKWQSPPGVWRWAYGLGLVVVTIMLGITGYLGGSIVFGPDHLAF